MRVIIAGGRDFADTTTAEKNIKDAQNEDQLHKAKEHLERMRKQREWGFQQLDEILLDLRPFQVIHGAARGGDAVGDAWARSQKLQIKAFPADWQQYGKRAGFVRNEQMAEYAAQDRANMLVAFWDGRSAGTKMMIEIARKMGIPSHIVPYNRLQVYTAPMRSETFALNPLIPVLNITRKSGGVNGEPFAPSANLVYPLIEKRREGTLTDKDYEEYRLKYIDEMRASYKEHPRAWNKLLDMEAVILTCYCTDPDRCHRTILAKDILAKLGAEYHGEVIPAPNQEYQDEPEQQDAPVMVANPKQTSLFSK